MAVKGRGWRLLASAAAAYALGSILTADIVARLARRDDVQDVRRVGTGNPGAANVTATMGKQWGAATLLGDLGKGMIAAQAGRLIVGDAGGWLGGTLAVVGHCFPLFRPAGGGKGIATSIGTTLVLFPVYVPIDIATGLVAWRLWQHDAARSMVFTSCVFVGASALWHRRAWPNLWGPVPGPGLPVYAALTTAAIAARFLPELGGASLQESKHKTGPSV